MRGDGDAMIIIKERDLVCQVQIMSKAIESSLLANALEKVIYHLFHATLTIDKIVQ